MNGSVLEGTTRDGGQVFLDGVDITADITVVNGLTRNDIIFDPPGDDPAFELHLSCSDSFTGGWGQSGGPVEGVDVNWQIAFFTVDRYNNNAFIKTCGNVVNPFDVPNTGIATGEDSSGTQTVSDEAIVTITEGIVLDSVQTNGKRLTLRLSNNRENEEITAVEAIWPTSNGDLKKIWLNYGGGNNDDIWAGSVSSADPAFVELSATVGPATWDGGTLLMGEVIGRFDFQNKVADGPYKIRISFLGGTYADVIVGARRRLGLLRRLDG